MNIRKGKEEGNKADQRHDMASIRGITNLAGTFQHGKLKGMLEVYKMSRRGWARTDVLSALPLQKLRAEARGS